MAPSAHPTSSPSSPTGSRVPDKVVEFIAKAVGGSGSIVVAFVRHEPEHEDFSSRFKRENTMPTPYQAASICTAFMLAAGAFAGDWVQFTDDTSRRLVASPGLGINDAEEKDYAWGDVDRDGDIDLVVVRKQIGSTVGRHRNVLFINEDGVLTDRTDDFAIATDDGGQGFLDLTNDRDVALVDVDGDGWLDIVTVTTFGQDLPKTISHPRIYLNLQEVGGVWQGFQYQEARFPELIMTPNFNGVGFGDVTGDDAPDLYFTDSFSNLEDRLLVNDGNGCFTDETAQRVPTWLTTSVFAPHAVIADLNHDGYNDILNLACLGPQDLRLAYNDPDNVGFFTQKNSEILVSADNWFISTGDLNNDELLDIVVVDHHDNDEYFLNQGNGPDGMVDWISFTFPDSAGGAGNNSVIADLDNDGFNDVLVADVDVDLPSCSNRLDIHHNLGDPPFVTFEEDVGNLPTNEGGPLRGTHDIAVFDIDGDCWLDLVIGTCTGTTVWINQGEGNICDETATTTPDDFDVVRGFHLSGDLADVLESDDSDLCYNPGIVLLEIEAPITLDFFGTLPNDSPLTLDVTIESSANTVGLDLTISFWNYNTSSWDVVGTDTQSLNTDTVRTIAGNPADHVEAGTGEVRTRYEVRVVSFIFVFPWTDCVDHVFWSTTN